MKTNFRLGDAAAPFAHLLGLGKRPTTGAKSRAEDDDEDKTAKAASRAQDDDGEDDRKKDDEEKDDKEAAAEEKDEGETDDGEDVEDDKKDSKRSKKAKGRRAKAEDDDDDKDKDAGVDGDGDDPDEEMRGHSAAAKARRRERARCKAIFACDAAGERPDVAASVAFDTTMPRNEAIAVLTATAAGQPLRAPRLADRMAETNVVHIGPENDAKAPAHLTPVAAAIIAAGERARGK